MAELSDFEKQMRDRNLQHWAEIEQWEKRREMQKILFDLYQKGCQEIMRSDGMGGATHFTEDSRGASAYMSFGLEDGTEENWFVEVHDISNYNPRDKFSVKIRKSWSAHEDFWNRIIESDAKPDTRAVIVNHRHYMAGLEEGPSYLKSDKSMRGFGGHLFQWQYLAEIRSDNDPMPTINRSTNMWFQGVIPPKFWDALPDNAVWVDTELAPPFGGD
jgi:hypothetical protein